MKTLGKEILAVAGGFHTDDIDVKAFFGLSDGVKVSHAKPLFALLFRQMAKLLVGILIGSIRTICVGI